MRADAETNRQRILDVARSALLEGSRPPMAAIARAAGVGQGTLYRHFPTWADLVLAVHRDEMNGLVAAGPQLLETYAPLEALRQWLQQLAAYGRLKHDLSDAMHVALLEHAPTNNGSLDLTALDALLAAGSNDGTLRGDITARDLLQLVSFLWRIEDGPDQTERCDVLLDVVINGLRTPS